MARNLHPVSFLTAILCALIALAQAPCSYAAYVTQDLERGDFDAFGVESPFTRAVLGRRKWGYINHAGAYVIPPKFDFVTSFYGGVATVQDSQGCYKIDRTGKRISPITARHEERTPLPWPPSYKYKGNIYDAAGKKVIAKSSDVRVDEFQEGLAGCSFRDPGRGEVTGFINTSGRLVIPANNRSVGGFCEGVSTVITFDEPHCQSAHGFIDKRGRLIANRPFCDVESFVNGYGIVKFFDGKTHQKGFIDRSGKLLTGNWINVKPFEKASKCAPVQNRSGLWGFINEKGEKVVDYSFQSIGQHFDEGLIEVSTNKGYGYVDLFGKTVIAPHFAYAIEFHDRLAAVAVKVPEKLSDHLFQHHQKWRCAFIDLNGVEIIPPKYHGAGHFSDGLAAVQVNSLWGFIDTTGKLVIKPQFENATLFSEGLAAVMKNGRWGFIDRSGSFVIAPEFVNDSFFGDGRVPTAPTPFSEGFTLAVLGDECWHCLNKSGKSLPLPAGGSRYFIPRVSQPFSHGLAVQSNAQVGQTFGFINKLGKFVIPPNLIDASSFSEGLASVEVWSSALTARNISQVSPDGDDLEKRAGFIDSKGNFVIAPRFRRAGSFSEGLAPVSYSLDVPVPSPRAKRSFVRDASREQWGFIDKQGKVRIPFQFDNAMPFFQGLAAVKRSGKWGFINPNGAMIIPAKYEQARSFSEGRAVVKINGKFGFIDRKGAVVVPPKYLLCGRFNDGRALVVKAVNSFSPAPVEAPTFVVVTNPLTNERHRLTLPKTQKEYIPTVQQFLDDSADVGSFWRGEQP
jgi:hypothetical protein